MHPLPFANWARRRECRHRFQVGLVCSRVEVLANCPMCFGFVANLNEGRNKLLNRHAFAYFFFFTSEEHQNLVGIGKCGAKPFILGFCSLLRDPCKQREELGWQVSGRRLRRNIPHGLLPSSEAITPYKLV